MDSSPAKRKLLVIVILGVLVISLLITVIVLAAAGRTDSSDDNEGGTAPECPAPVVSPRTDFFEWSGLNDGLDATWYNLDIETDEDVENFVPGNHTFIDIHTVANRQMTKLINKLKSTKTTAVVRPDFDASTDNITDIMQDLDNTDFRNPVLITLPLVFDVKDISRLIEDANAYTPDGKFVFSFDLAGISADFAEASSIGRGVVETVDQIAREIKYSMAVEVSADRLTAPETWENLKWLLDKNDDLLLIISLAHSSKYTSSTVYDLLRVRNDIETTKVLYNIAPSEEEMRQTAQTAGSPLHYFKIPYRDAGKIIWSHNTDTWQQITAAIEGDVMMIEGDIQVYGQNTTNQTHIPIMAHDYGDYNNITFEEWLDEIIKVGKGMKFDFKSIDAVAPSLAIVNSKRDLIKAPIWLNADIQPGPGAGPPRIPTDQFLNDTSAFPAATLSLGWTTVQKGDNYNLALTMEMAERMHEICKDLPMPVTFPARAEQLVDSWPALSWLLKQSRGYTLTVWTAHGDNVTRSDMEYIKQRSERSRVYFDLPEDLRP